ncbi:hypothetical protein [Caulobacter soli]|uniref:hypothetical protein n=1 Tax=Caulobacter soli TaxID=2708539 RepID=UPI0013E9F213|nr:hypothetical protein [Caulobacter soli]
MFRVDRQADAEPPVLDVAGLGTEQRDGTMVSFVAEKLGQDKTVLGLDELVDAGLFREADEALPNIGRSIPDEPAKRQGDVNVGEGVVGLVVDGAARFIYSVGALLVASWHRRRARVAGSFGA